MIMSFTAMAWRFLYYQAHIFHTAAVFGSGGDYIYASCIDTTVPKYVGELCDVLLDTVEYPGEEMTEIVREHLLRVYVSLFAK